MSTPHNGAIDAPTDIRNGEALDAAAVTDLLRDIFPGVDGPVEIRQFPSGFSNLTYLVTLGGEEVILRRPPRGTKAAGAHDMGREYRMLMALRPLFPYCPEVLYYEDTDARLGSPFYIMERIRGIILRKNLPAGLSFSPADAGALCRRLVSVQRELHAVDYRRVDLGPVKPEGYVARQVDGWSRRYRAARTPDAPDFEAVMAWLADHQPADTTSPAIVHNDFKFDNVVLEPSDPMTIIGVLDWEMATVGDPLMDLGSSLAYWVQADDAPELQALRLMPTHIPGALTRREIVGHYGSLSGLDTGEFSFYYTFGLFRLAVIAQQIYYRYYKGQTADKRFEMLIFAVHALEKTARMASEEGFI
ncbi:MAG: phosphotransferase family protein [Pseudomonadota bacterium]